MERKEFGKLSHDNYKDAKLGVKWTFGNLVIIPELLRTSLCIGCMWIFLEKVFIVFIRFSKMTKVPSR